MKKSDIAYIIIIVCGVMGFLATPILLRMSSFEKDVEGGYHIPVAGKTISDVEIRVQVQGGEVNILKLSDDSLNIVEADWLISHTGIYVPELSVIMSYNVHGSTIKINIFCIIDEIHIENLILNVYYNPSYTKYSFFFNTGAGNLILDASELNFKHFEFISSSGGLNLQLNNSNITEDFKLTSNTGEQRVRIDNTTFSKDFLCQTYSGDLFFDLWNLKFETVADFNVANVKGFSNIKWANHYNKSQKVNVNIDSNGIAKMKFWCPLEIMRSDVSAFTIDGEFDFITSTGTYIELSETHFQTANIDDMSLDVYNITLNCPNGEAELHYVNCFKWQRICAYGNDFQPYNTTNSGNYTIRTQHHSVSAINLYNNKYIYLNESRNLILNYQELPISSHNLIHVDWYIKYLHAMGIGKAPVSIAISNSTIGDQISIFVKVDFLLDKILPTFSDYNITIFYHPSYSFNHFLI